MGDREHDEGGGRRNEPGRQASTAKDEQGDADKEHRDARPGVRGMSPLSGGQRGPTLRKTPAIEIFDGRGRRRSHAVSV